MLLIISFTISWFFGFLKFVLNTEKIDTIFLKDPLTSKPNFTKKILIISSIYAVLWHLKFLIFGDTVAGLEEETLIEHLSSLLFLLSAIVLIISIFYRNNIPVSKKDKGIIKK